MDRLGGARRGDGEPGEGMPPAHVLDEDSGSLSAAAYDVRRSDRKPSVLLIGRCSGSTFVAAEVFICADTLETEAAIRAWLSKHDIRLSG
jgi:hypothetical protein